MDHHVRMVVNKGEESTRNSPPRGLRIKPEGITSIDLYHKYDEDAISPDLGILAENMSSVPSCVFPLEEMLKGEHKFLSSLNTSGSGHILRFGNMDLRGGMQVVYADGSTKAGVYVVETKREDIVAIRLYGYQE